MTSVVALPRHYPPIPRMSRYQTNDTGPSGKPLTDSFGLPTAPPGVAPNSRSSGFGTVEPRPFVAVQPPNGVAEQREPMSADRSPDERRQYTAEEHARAGAGGDVEGVVGTHIDAADHHQQRQHDGHDG